MRRTLEALLAAAIVAVEAAKRYVEGALRNAEPIGHGHGPMNHLWSLRRG